MISPLSQSQLSIYLASQGLDENSGNYQQAILFRLPADIDIQRLGKALEAFVAAHPYLLSHISESDGMPCMEESGESWHAQIRQIDSINAVRAGFAQPMDLHRDQLFRLELYQTPEGNYLYADFHHIVTDGACIPIFLSHVGQAYDGGELPAEKMSGADIAREEQQLRESEAFEEARQWFAQEFAPATELESRILPDIFGEPQSAYQELMVDLPLDSAVMREILERYRYADSILFTAMFGLTLSAWNAENGASFSTIWNGRKGVASKSAFTMCVHTLPAYVNADPETPVSEVFERMKAQVLGLRARHFFSMADCNSYLGLGPGINFGFQGQFVPADICLSLDGKVIPGEDLRTNPPGLSLSVECFTPVEGPYKLRFWYRPSEYSEGILRGFAESMATAVLSLRKADTVGQIDFASPAQLKTLDEFNPGEAGFDTEKTVVELFRQRVKEAPQQTALVCGERSLSYAEADRLSDRLAAYIEKTVRPGSVISIILGRSEYTLIAPLGVLKAGCSYQPLDPSYPKDRLQFMVKDAASALLIADEGLAELVEGFEGPILPTAQIPDLPEGRPTACPGPDDLFVLLYTSGTTGTPKGCMLNHRNISIFAQNHALRTGITAQSRLTAYSSFGFDAFVGDLYATLAAGATLYLIPEEIRLDLNALHAYFEKNGVTHSFMTTQVATQFAINYPDCKGLQVLYTGGEKLSSLPLPKYRIFNCFGPTESICYTISKEVGKQEENIPIGTPLPGIHAYVVNKAGKRVPVGAVGELLEAGLQVGDGYLGLPEKTAEAFADNPYESNPAFRRLYRTGDIVRYRADGDIEYIGRKDAQVKIRGFRIELKEVEAVIREFPGIQDVTVQAFDQEGGGKFLAAYVVSGQTVDTSALNAFILERKPPYMVPAVTMQIDAIPLNVNQKVDKKALPKPQVRRAEGQAAAPLNLLEEELSSLLKETTGIEGAGLTEPLMLYGLSSISGLRLATELYKRYGIQADMNSFAKTATLQGIENEILKKWMEGGAASTQEGQDAALTAQPLTNQQAGVYFDCMKAPHETIYNIPMVWTFPGEVSGQALQEAVLKVLSAHPALQSRFEQREGQVYQVPTDIPIPVSLKEGSLEAVRADFIQPFDLSAGPLGKVEILKEDGKTYLLSDFHHLVFDGRSYDLFIQEVCAALEGKDIAPEAYTYYQYAAWQKASEGSEAYTQAREFFASQLAGMESPTAVIPDLENQEQGGREVFLQKAVEADIHPLCQKMGISPASFYLGAAYLTLSAYSASRKVYICTISNGRGNLKTADSFGMFVNTLALAGDCSIPDRENYLKRCDQDFQATLQHQDYPFAKVAAESGFQPQVMLAYQVGVLADYRVNGRKVSGESLEAGAPKFPLSIYIDGSEGQERIVLGYDDSKYSEALMQAFADAMECVVRGLLKHEKLSEIPFVDGARLNELQDFNHYSQPVDGRQTIVSLFRAQAKKTPDAPAVRYEDFACTYAEADALTDRIAAAIAAKGLGPEDVVSVLIGRNQWMALASLGILKAGCAYQPLDPSYPRERLNFMITDASAKLLVADRELLPLLDAYEGPVLATDELEALPEGPQPEGPKPENLFILLYTSGSTGVPKGVMLEHRNLVNFCAWYRSYYSLDDNSRVAAYASYGFDACMMDMYPALTSGACVHIIPEETRHDMGQLDAFISRNGITHSFMTTQVGVMYAKNYPDNASLRHLSVGGEKLVSMDPPSYGFHNGYGPTECTIFSTVFDVLKREPNIPIGHALDNTFMYVTDSDFRLLPVGAAGELLIAGAGVGRGYLNRPEKTAECFIDNPFHQGMRAYRSGDIVRWRTDGNIEFVGRQDGQVKIRGFRVELKEVEEVLRECPGIKDVTVQAFDNPSGGKFIAAYVVAEGKFDIPSAVAFIKDRKPPYMVPAAFIQLDKIPLNVNQKVDRKALPKPTPDTSQDYVAPVGETEKKLCEVFAEVLSVEKVGATDNFFDLGGSSLMVTNVLVNAGKRGLKFAYADVFAHPTARDLAAFLGGGADTPVLDQEISGYDYSDIDTLLQGNTLEALATGTPQSLEGHILLTGATGFLGIHMLRELLESTPEDTVIWCLLRSKGTLSAERRLKEMLVYYFEKDYRPLFGKRIRIVEGDITRPEDFAALQASGTPWTLAVNCAANVKHFSKGTDIEDINYGGARNLCDFCEATGARLVHVSTESVAGSSIGSTPTALTEQLLYFGQQTGNQYVHSKFMAERYILERMAAGKLNAKIMRAGNLSPRASDGEFQVNMNANSAMGRIKAYKLLGACPYSLLDAAMEFSPIDDTARAMVLLARTPRENCVFNVSNNHLLPMEDILSRLGKLDGKEIEYLEFPDFLARMQAMMAQPDKAPLLSSLVAYAQSPSQAESVMNPPSFHFTMQVLYRLDFHWNKTSSHYVDMIFEMLRTLQYFS
jgi:amino acid adenylation domain-containing protein